MNWYARDRDRDRAKGHGHVRTKTRIFCLAYCFATKGSIATREFAPMNCFATEGSKAIALVRFYRGKQMIVQATC